jgi:hypothetical protein
MGKYGKYVISGGKSNVICALEVIDLTLFGADTEYTSNP